MPNLGFSLQLPYDLPVEAMLPLLKRAGFSALSPAWTPELALDSLSVHIRAQGMSLQSLHAPTKGMPLLWTPENPLSAPVQENYLRCAEDCARFGIPVLVLHGWQGIRYTFPETPLDFRFFDRLVDHVRNQNISLAFENLEGEEYLDALLTRYGSESHVGFCWDSGHDHCYPHTMDFLARFGQRLLMTHLSDNFGLLDPSGIPCTKDDLHLLPFDGDLDWPHAIQRLHRAARQHTLNLELKYRPNPFHPLPPLEQWISLAGQRGEALAALYENAPSDSKPVCDTGPVL